MTEVDKRASAWRDADGDIHQTYRGAKYYCTGDEKPEPLYSAATVTALEAEVERLRVIEEAARVYYREYCQDEAGDEPDDDGRGLWTGASAKQINDAATLRDALTGAGAK